jgi:NADPH:quinone reductase-like Zn-dependent oxidoreductase
VSGIDFAGVADAVGEGATRFAAGDRAFGPFRSRTASGSFINAARKKLRGKSPRKAPMIAMFRSACM